MDIIKAQAYAKLNISLDVAEKRPDGYHDMVMVMQTVSLCDEITITPNDTGRVQARSNLPFVPGDERNRAVRAALQYLRAVGREGQGLDIRLEKHIAVGAGLLQDGVIVGSCGSSLYRSIGLLLCGVDL